MVSQFCKLIMYNILVYHLLCCIHENWTAKSTAVLSLTHRNEGGLPIQTGPVPVQYFSDAFQ
jgi:hypothetical protein